MGIVLDFDVSIIGGRQAIAGNSLVDFFFGNHDQALERRWNMQQNRKYFGIGRVSNWNVFGENSVLSYPVSGRYGGNSMSVHRWSLVTHIGLTAQGIEEYVNNFGPGALAWGENV